MENFKAYRLTETPDRKIKAEFVDMTLDDLDPGDVVVRVAYSTSTTRTRSPRPARASIPRRLPLRRRHRRGRARWCRRPNPAFKQGDAVIGIGYDFGVSHHGGYAQYARVPADWLMQLPQGMTL